MVCDQTIVPLALLDPQGRYWYVNDALCRLLGYERPELLGRRAQDITADGEPVLGQDVFTNACANGSDGAVLERHYRCRDGSTIWTLLSTSVVRDTAGTLSFFLVQFQDITGHRESEILWQRTFDNAPNGMVLLDLQGRLHNVNDAFCALLGYQRHDLLGRSFKDFTYPDDQEQGSQAVADLVAGRREVVTVRKRYRHRDGHPLWVLIRASAVPGPDGHTAFIVSQCEEIGNGRMADADVAHLALHDPLTGLANRALLTDQLESKLAALKHTGGSLAVVLVDVDELKPVNDRFGHIVGDELLTAAAHRLLLAARPGDVVARLGGDEFVVVSDVADLSAAKRLRLRIVEHLDTEIQVGEHRLQLSASAGLAATSDPTTQARTLLHRADRSMYLHKHQSRLSPGQR